MPQRSPFSNLDNPLRTAGGGLQSEIAGAVIAALGVLLAFTVLRYDPASGAAPPFLVVLGGWTALPMALALIVLGGVLLLRRRAGYWSAEALVGSELLLLGLQAGTFIVANDVVDWAMRLDGNGGGLIGWATGSLLMAALDRWLALMVVVCAVLIGLVMLLRYTPLVYVAVAVGRWLPVLPATGQKISHFLRLDRGAPAGYPPLPHTPNFVLPAGAETMPTRTTAAPAFVSAAAPPAIGPPAATRRAKPTPSANAPAEPTPAPKAPASKQAQPAKAAPAPRPALAAASLPPIDLLDVDPGVYSNADVTQLKQILLKTLEDFNVPAQIVHVESGPTVTQFGVEPLYVERAGQKRKVRVNRIVSLANDLALALAAPAIRIEAPVPGRPYVGIEVPNPSKSLVSLRGLVESPDMRKGGILAIPLGRNTAGHPVVMDLTRAPHLLIAGSTGSGKSVCINTVITGLLMQHGPEMLRFILVDPKMVELPGYNGIPHLYGKVITDVEHVMGALTWLLLQMDDRYALFRDKGVRNIDAYNAIVRKQKSGEPLPYLVLVIDELADLMMTAAENIEHQICRLAQMARATGIHLVLATQRPSVNVITGLIKANFPTRISFAVTSQIDSRVILDTPGAETLLGRGDMLLMRPDAGKLTRLQGCYVSDEEITRVVAYWKTQGTQTGAVPPPWNSIMDHLGDEDELILEATDVLRGMRSCSTSMLQRRMGLGYPKAARLMEELEKRRVVGPDLGAGRGREVLVKKEQEADGEDSDDERTAD